MWTIWTSLISHVLKIFISLSHQIFIRCQIGATADRKVGKKNSGCAPTSFWHVAARSARRSTCSSPSCKRPINNRAAISKAQQQLKLLHGQPPYNWQAPACHCRDIIGDDVCCRCGGWNRRQNCWLILISHPWRESSPSHGAAIAQQAQWLELSSQWFNYSLKQTQWF